MRKCRGGTAPSPIAERAGYDGAIRRKGTKVHAVVDTLSHLLALRATAANEHDRAQVGALAAEVQSVTGDHAELAYVYDGYTGAAPAQAAAVHGRTQKDPTGLLNIQVSRPCAFRVCGSDFADLLHLVFAFPPRAHASSNLSFRQSRRSTGGGFRACGRQDQL